MAEDGDTGKDGDDGGTVKGGDTREAVDATGAPGAVC